MNASSSGIWDNPPPPGTEDDQPVSDVKLESGSPRAIDRIDPFLKNPEYLEYEKKSGRHKGRSRSISYDRYEKRRRSRSRSRSKSRYHSRRSRSHRKRRYSRSRSRSPSKSRGRYNKRDKDKRSKRYSRSRNSSHSRYPSRSRHSSRSRYSRSKSRSRSPSKSSKSYRHRRNSRDFSDNDEKPVLDSSYESIDMKPEDEEEPELVRDNAFKNDGSFLEMFKKMQEEKKAQEESQKAENEKNKMLPTFGKRRGGRVLKTGMVQKSKPQDMEETVHDPWSVYMKEVKKYKEACCDDDSKSRLLVK